MFAAFSLLALAPMALPVEAARVRPQLLIVVREEGHEPLSADMLRRIGAEAREIWRPYVDITFRFGGDVTPHNAGATVDLVLTDRQSNGRLAPGLGWIDFVDGEPSRTITVSVAAARGLAGRGSWAGRRLSAWPRRLREIFLVRALGRGVAHEVGHYLLRSTHHTLRGLMRPRFTVDEIMETGLDAYRLLPADEAVLAARATSDLLARRRAEGTPPQ